MLSLVTVRANLVLVLGAAEAGLFPSVVFLVSVHFLGGEEPTDIP